MDEAAVFSITYGLFILASEWDGRRNACVINTLAQVTQEPIRMSITVQKTSFTHDFVLGSGKFSISVLAQNADLGIVGHFGCQSGRTVDKFADFACETFASGNPKITKGCIAVMDCTVVQVVDLGTHTLFIADLADAVLLSGGKPLSYGLYRDIRMGKVVQPTDDGSAAPTKVSGDVWQCPVCHYVYDGGGKFEDLPADYVCPLCNVKKEVFVHKSAADIGKKKEPVAVGEEIEVYRCGVCGYTYEGEVPFEDLPDDFACPVCNVAKDIFEVDKIIVSALGGGDAHAETWQCDVCHYTYDGDLPFENLPDGYKCPLCGVGRESFSKLGG